MIAIVPNINEFVSPDGMHAETQARVAETVQPERVRGLPDEHESRSEEIV